MDIVPLELAFSRLGAQVQGRQRLLSAMAGDGSLVLVCQSSGFSRPGPGVLRYSAKLSEIAKRSAQVTQLRAGLAAASTGGTTVRLIIQTPAAGGGPGKVHTRADLVGSVSAFDGDAYSVDFLRLEEEEPEPAPRGRRRR
jgi:hypothetical protein